MSGEPELREEVVEVYEAIAEELEAAKHAAFSEAKAARSHALRGKRVRAFDARGLHPFSVEVGRVQALESILGVPGESATDIFALRRQAEELAEVTFAADFAERGAAVFEDARRENRGGA